MAHALRAAGHPVFAPTLTGLAERRSLLNRDTCLETHIADVVALVTAHHVRQVVLVGHSYGGMAITGAVALAPERIATLVCLDAFVPGVGDSVMSLSPPDRAATDAAAMGVTAPGDAARLEAHLTEQPLLAFIQPLSRAAPPPPALARHYIRCTEGSPSFAAVAARLRADPAWTSHELPAGHNAMVTEPEALAALLSAT